MPTTINGLPILPSSLSGNEVIYIKDPSRTPCDYQLPLTALCAICSYNSEDVNITNDVTINGVTYDSTTNIQTIIEQLADCCNSGDQVNTEQVNITNDVTINGVTYDSTTNVQTIIEQLAECCDSGDQVNTEQVNITNDITINGVTYDSTTNVQTIIEELAGNSHVPATVLSNNNTILYTATGVDNQTFDLVVNVSSDPNNAITYGSDGGLYVSTGSTGAAILSITDAGVGASGMTSVSSQSIDLATQTLNFQNGLHVGDTRSAELGGQLIHNTIIDTNSHKFEINDFGAAGSMEFHFDNGTNSVDAIYSSSFLQERVSDGTNTVTRNHSAASHDVVVFDNVTLDSTTSEQDADQFRVTSEVIGSQRNGYLLVRTDESQIGFSDTIAGYDHSVKFDANGTYITTPNISAGTATVGQVLTLMDAATGRVEYQNAPTGGGGGTGTETTFAATSNNFSMNITPGGTAGHTPNLEVWISDSIGNQLYVHHEGGLYVSGVGGGGNETTFAAYAVDNSINIVPGGGAGHSPGFQVKLSAQAGNTLVLNNDGLYVGSGGGGTTGSQSTFAATSNGTIQITPGGSFGHTPQLNVNISGVAGNNLSIASDGGLYVAAGGGGGTTSDTNFATSNLIATGNRNHNWNNHNFLMQNVGFYGINSNNGVLNLNFNSATIQSGTGANASRLLLIDGAVTGTSYLESKNDLEISSTKLLRIVEDTWASTPDNAPLLKKGTATGGDNFYAPYGLPTGTGSAGQVLTTNANGTTSWTTITSTGGGGGTETTFAATSSNNTIQITPAGTAGHTPNLRVRVSSQGGNVLTVNTDGLYVAASGGSATSITGLIQAGNNTTITGNGTSASPYVVNAIVPNVTETTFAATSSNNTIQITPAGTAGHTPNFAVNISAQGGNTLVSNADGLYVAASGGSATSITGLIQAGNNTSITGNGTNTSPYIVNAIVPNFTETTFAATSNGTIQITPGGTAGHTPQLDVNISGVAGNNLSIAADGGLYVASGGGGTTSDTNFAITDLTATGNRTHNWAGNDFTFNNYGTVSFNNVNSLLTLSSLGTVLRCGNGTVNSSYLSLNRNTNGLTKLQAFANLEIKANGDLRIVENTWASTPDNAPLLKTGSTTTGDNFYAPYGLPTNTGSANQVLTTDGNGNTSWTTVSGGSNYNANEGLRLTGTTIQLGFPTKNSTPDITVNRHINTGKLGLVLHTDDNTGGTAYYPLSIHVRSNDDHIRGINIQGNNGTITSNHFLGDFNAEQFRMTTNRRIEINGQDGILLGNNSSLINIRASTLFIDPANGGSSPTGYILEKVSFSGEVEFRPKHQMDNITSYSTTAAAASDTSLPTGRMFKVNNGNGTSQLHIKD